MLEGLLKGLVLWIYEMILEGVNYMANALLDVFNMDLSYFEQYAPVTGEIVQIIIAAGWALLVGNMAFQAMRSMAAGIGFEGENPVILFTRTFVFGFLLVASRQVCNIGLSITATVMDLMQIPDSVTINTPDESMLGAFDGAWIWMVIIGIILIWQIIKFFFEIGERYVVLAVLTIMAPLAFGMGGSKNTEDIFKGWSRMYGSMCVMMLMNVVFLKLLLSAMSTVPTGLGLIPWLIFVVAIARVGRKVDDLVCRVGLNPARTGDPLGRGLPVMVSMMVAKNLGKTLAGTFAANKLGPKPAGGATGASAGSPRPGPAGPAGSPGGNAGSPGSQRGSSSGTYSPRGASAQAGQTAATGSSMRGTILATGQAAQTATNAAGQGLGAPEKAGRQHQQGQAARQESHNHTSAGQPMDMPLGQGVQGARPARTRPVNLDVEYREPQLQTPASATTTHQGGSQRNSSTAQAKTADSTMARPLLQRTPRGNFPQAPVGAGVTSPQMAHNVQQINDASTNVGQSQTTFAAENASRPPIPLNRPITGSTNVQSTNSAPNTAVQKPTSSPLTDARSAGAGFDRGTQPPGANRPPIGHHATVNSFSQESQSITSGRDSAPQNGSPSVGRNNTTQNHAVIMQTTPQSDSRNGTEEPKKPFPPARSMDRGTGATPSLGRNAAPTGAASHSRDTDTHSVASVAQPALPSHGRNGASAPQSHFSLAQNTNRSTSSSPSPSRNGAQAPQTPLPPAHSADRGSSSAPSPSRNSTPQGAPPSGGRNESPKRPPIGRNRKPVGGDEN